MWIACLPPAMSPVQTSRDKFLFDECVTKALMERLAAFLRETGCDYDFAYLMDRVGAGAKDRDWIPSVAAEGWIIVTADRGKQTKGGSEKKLPQICAEYGATHILLSASLHQLPTNNKLRALIGVWDSLIQACEAKGSRVFVFRHSDGNWHTKKSKVDLGPKTKQPPLPLDKPDAS